MRNPRLAAAAAHAFVAVAAGAWAAHGLEKVVASLQHVEWFETGARYQMYHALGLFGLSFLGTRERALRLAGHFLQIGILLFSGSLYVMALSDVRGFGAVAPIGGLGFLIGWGLIAAHACGCCSSRADLSGQDEPVEHDTAGRDGS